MKRTTSKPYAWQKNGPNKRPGRPDQTRRNGQANSKPVILGVLLILGMAAIGLFVISRPHTSPINVPGQIIAASAPDKISNTPLPQLPSGQNTPQPIPPTDAPSISETPPSSEMDVPAMQRLMLELINDDRQANGLKPVDEDNFADQVGIQHAQEMATNNYFSHWDMRGYGPDVRYSLAGGIDAVQENIYSYYLRFDDGRPAPINNWPQVVRDAEKALMESPGHRVNILNADHTHVGIGVAYNSQTGEVRIAQEFVNRHISLSPVPRTISSKDELEINGLLLPDSTNPFINLAYEALPQPITPDDLNNRMPDVYSSPAEAYDVIQPTVNGDQFTANLRLNVNDRAGLYHIRVWCQSNGRDILATDVVVEVR